ncbi:nicotinate (nicotinamide) nucleotide adenylyltransferase [bacterium]|nr:nicotinate (nicotinamide) nucleotide adenylyltransferase [bacterium]MBU1636489.1 nicotinate (nicotinamide) nucleotide adenylyltransferase [bacterium]MBU1921414.1 nicotinate (nicotinamide) nucleotide adenylyltransferase [bacterium]
MIRLGMFGGTFDPVHYGHLKPLEAARRELELDRILMLPNPQPPHKEHLVLTPYAHRKKMLQLALAEFPRLECADFEESAVGPAYTSDTVRRIIAILPPKERELWLIIGADSLLEMPLWHDPEAIFRDTKIAVLPRPGVNLEDARPDYKARVRILNTPLVDISATQIRESIKGGAVSSRLLPRSVLEYIRTNKLYEN